MLPSLLRAGRAGSKLPLARMQGVRLFSSLTLARGAPFSASRGHQVTGKNAPSYPPVRFASAAAEGHASEDQLSKKKPTLKSVLRRFYLLTHPDKFADHPIAKTQNEHSLREFLSFIEEYKRNPQGTPLGKARRVPLVFFVHDKAGQLRKVEAELLANSSNPQAAKRRLGNLFAAVGLDGDFTFEHDVWLPPDTEHIADFLSASVAHARNVLIKATQHRTHTNAVVSEIERLYGVRVSLYTGFDSYWAPSENRQVADKLASLMQILAEKKRVVPMRGVELALDSETDSSAASDNGVIYLSRRETVDDWEHFLRGVDWPELHGKMASVQRKEFEEARVRVASENSRKPKEDELIKALGVRTLRIQSFNRFEGMLSAEDDGGKRKDDDEDEVVEDFEKQAHTFVDNMLASKKLFAWSDKRVANKIKHLEVVFCPNMPKPMTYHMTRTGKFRISTKLTPKQIADLLISKCVKARELILEDDKYSAIRDYVEVRLGLKLLTVDYTFYYSQPESLQQSRQAMVKLQKIAEQLRGHQLSGMTMIISDHYAMHLDGSLVIKWDFKDEEVMKLLSGATAPAPPLPEEPQPTQAQPQAQPAM